MSEKSFFITYKRTFSSEIKNKIKAKLITRLKIALWQLIFHVNAFINSSADFTFINHSIKFV